MFSVSASFFLLYPNLGLHRSNLSTCKPLYEPSVHAWKPDIFSPKTSPIHPKHPNHCPVRSMHEIFPNGQPVGYAISVLPPPPYIAFVIAGMTSPQLDDQRGFSLCSQKSTFVFFFPAFLVVYFLVFRRFSFFQHVHLYRLLYIQYACPRGLKLMIKSLFLVVS